MSSVYNQILRAQKCLNAKFKKKKKKIQLLKTHKNKVKKLKYNNFFLKVDLGFSLFCAIVTESILLLESQYKLM